MLQCSVETRRSPFQPVRSPRSPFVWMGLHTSASDHDHRRASNRPGIRLVSKYLFVDTASTPRGCSRNVITAHMTPIQFSVKRPGKHYPGTNKKAAFVPWPSKPIGNGTKTRPPRRSRAEGVVACRQRYVKRRTYFVLLTVIPHSPARKSRCDSTRPRARRSNRCKCGVVSKQRGPNKRPRTRRRSRTKQPVDR